ncbi:hypothetical protein EHM92_09445, partial [bacterium]
MIRSLCCSAAAFILMGSGTIACGQEQDDTLSLLTRHALTVSAGLDDFHIKDEYLSPIIFGGNTFASEASFSGESGDQIYAIDLRFSTGSLNSEAQPRNVTQYTGYLSFSLAWKLGTSSVAGSPLDIWLGGGLSSFVANTDFNTFG